MCGEFTFDVFVDLRRNVRLSTQSWGWWFETTTHPLWRHPNDDGDNWFSIMTISQTHSHEVTAWERFPHSWPFVKGIHQWLYNETEMRSFGVSCQCWWFETSLRSFDFTVISACISWRCFLEKAMPINGVVLDIMNWISPGSDDIPSVDVTTDTEIWKKTIKVPSDMNKFYCLKSAHCLRHRWRHARAAILLTTIWNAFPCMEIIVCLFSNHWNEHTSIDSNNGLTPNRRQAHFLNNDGLVYWGTYAKHGLDDLPHLPCTKWPPNWQTTISNAFLWMKMIEFRFEFHWNVFPGVHLTLSQHWFR